MTLRLAPKDIVTQSTSPLLATADWWERCPLGDIAQVTNGAAFKSARFNNNEDGLPLIRIRDVGQPRASTHYSGDYEDRHLVESGNLLIGMDGDFRIARWTGGRALLNQRVCRVQVHDPDLYCDRFLEYVLQPYLDEIHKVTSSVTVKHLSSRTLTDLPIPLPPRAEQERVVGTIEEHFSRLDAIQAALAQILHRIEALRTAVLHEIFTIELRDAPSLERVPLRDLLAHTIGGVWGSAPGEDEQDVDVARVTELRGHGSLSLDTAARRSITDKQLMSRRLEPGDVLLEKSGGGPKQPVGRVARFMGHSRDAVCTNFMQLLRPDKTQIDSAFLAWQLHARYLSGHTASMNKGSGNIRNLQMETYLTQPMLVVPQASQSLICRRIEDSYAVAHQIESSAQAALARVDALRRSVLAQAFAGQLVQQDPNDEPASMLLERIAKSRPTKPRRRKALE